MNNIQRVCRSQRRNRNMGHWFIFVLGISTVLSAVMLCGGIGSGFHEGDSATTIGSIERDYEVSSVAELRSALALVPASGGAIRLTAGYYVLDGPLEIQGKNCVSLIGSGWACRIIRQGDGDLLRLSDAGFCEIRNMLLLGDHSANSGSAIVLTGISCSCTIDSCRIMNFPDSGVRFEGASSHPMSSNTVRNCHLIGNLGDQLYSQHNNDFYIVGNQFGTHRGHPQTGCVLDHSSAGSYSLNYHWGNQVAIRMGPAANYNRVENNRFEECRESAMVIGSDEETDWNMFHIITGNTFHTNSQSRSGEFPAVVANNAHQVTFCQNQIFSWNAPRIQHKHGVVVGPKCSEWIIRDNIFRHNTGDAVICHATDTMLIKDNLAK
jgi:hypothetical protein